MHLVNEDQLVNKSKLSFRHGSVRTCTAMKPPEERPETVMSSEMLYVPSGASAAIAVDTVRARMAMVCRKEESMFVGLESLANETLAHPRCIPVVLFYLASIAN